MLRQIEAKNFRPNSLNWIAPSKAMNIQWCTKSWDQVTLGNLQKGCKKVFMDPRDLEEVSKSNEVKDFSTFSSDVCKKQPQGEESVLDT